MKLLSKSIERDGSGYVRLICEEDEDMWHVYNLLNKGDQLKSSTERRVRLDTATGSADSTRVKLTITISITEIEFDTSTCLLRINGKNITENKYIKLGAFHTIDLELNQTFTLIKEHWDSMDMERIKDACDVTKSAEVAAIVLQEGLANVCLVTSHMTIVRQRIEAPIPRKRRGSVTNHEKGLLRFFDQVYQALVLHFNFEVLKVIIIAGPGFIKDQFYTYIFDQAIKQDNKVILQNKFKFIPIHASSGHKHALQEVMADPTIKIKMSDTKATREVSALDKFYVMLDRDPDRAFYGIQHVKLANQSGAIQTLLITDELFRSADIPTRKMYNKMVQQTRNSGGEALVFSSLHISGEQLNQLSGIAAILKFPLPDIEDIEVEEG
ncbi:hypothetical protein K502DRAFT_339394 [Neoconidiobolus thromboides FSU 785]|nr:hypothetical protein K502DRAFT_339394 [Neoconidiobolus thromboides FSU 785]